MKNEKNAIIRINLNTLLEILEARAFVKIYVGENEIFSGNVYEKLNDAEFNDKYGWYRVVGLASTISFTTILIEDTFNLDLL